jgi:hypothetical protein
MTRQIPFLHWQTLKDGSQVAHWKPSPALRKSGFQNQRLGQRQSPRDREATKAATRAAEALNDKVAEWRAGKSGARAAASAPRKWRFIDLADAYRASDEWRVLGPKTKAEYGTRLRQLEFWAEEGMLPVRSIDRDMVRDLKKGLLADEGSLFRCASTMRVLRLLLNWAKGEGIVEVNATEGVKIPSTPKRGVLLLESEVAAVAATAAANGHPSVALAFEVGLWSFQREADLLGLTRMNWRTIDNCAPADAAVLANPRGDVKGFRLQQGKTGAWVDCPMPPWLHDRIEAAFALAASHGHGFLLHDDANPARVERPAAHDQKGPPCAIPEWLFQRRARAAMDACGLPAKRFRDLRRSGMSMFRDLGVETAAIVTISGHAVIGHSSVLDHYMPANTRAACAALATALRTRGARQLKDQAQ